MRSVGKEGRFGAKSKQKDKNWLKSPLTTQNKTQFRIQTPGSLAQFHKPEEGILFQGDKSLSLTPAMGIKEMAIRYHPKLLQR